MLPLSKHIMGYMKAEFERIREMERLVEQGKLHKHSCMHCGNVFYCDWEKKPCNRPLCSKCNDKRVKMKAEGKERNFWSEGVSEQFEFKPDSDDD